VDLTAWLDPLPRAYIHPSTPGWWWRGGGRGGGGIGGVVHLRRRHPPYPGQGRGIGGWRNRGGGAPPEEAPPLLRPGSSDNRGREGEGGWRTSGGGTLSTRVSIHPIYNRHITNLFPIYNSPILFFLLGDPLLTGGGATVAKPAVALRALWLSVLFAGHSSSLWLPRVKAGLLTGLALYIIYGTRTGDGRTRTRFPNTGLCAGLCLTVLGPTVL